MFRAENDFFKELISRLNNNINNFLSEKIPTRRVIVRIRIIELIDFVILGGAQFIKQYVPEKPVLSLLHDYSDGLLEQSDGEQVMCKIYELLDYIYSHRI